ncbi:MAG: SUMF1/EgtB/PvdO family nonheme iron enzyme [Labilithrix sp.]|nr:SUMF1/EgtB/PvdO family nonheme iron enzyme [Labilithrix sp.]
MGSPASEWGRGAYSEDEVAMILTHDFLIGQNELTQREWVALGYPNPSGPYFDAGIGDCTDNFDCPVGGVTWYEALAYANALSDRDALPRCYELASCTGKVGEGFRCESATLTATSLYECRGYRLPTEVEWEYAARAGTRTAFFSGEITSQGQQYNECCRDEALEPVAWYCANSGGHTHPVGSKAPNAWGLFDVLGNVSEWVNDPPTGGTVPGPLTDYGGDLPARPSSLTRGGNFMQWAVALRLASGALSYPRGERRTGLGVGFRLVRSLPIRDE